MNRKWIIIGLIVLFGAVTFFTWGSVGSAITGYGALMLVSALVKDRFADSPYEDDYIPPEE